MSPIDDSLNPSIEEVRVWGYDDELVFIDQDEDLLLHSPDYVEILIELAVADDCPKRDYCYSILSYYSSLILSHRSGEVIGVLNRAKNYTGVLDERVTAWKDRFVKVAELMINPRALSIGEAEQLAYLLTVGDFSTREFNKGKTFPSGVLEFIASTRSYNEYFYINPQTGVWRVSRHFPVDEVNF